MALLVESAFVSMWPFPDVESTIFAGAIIRICGNLISGLFAILTYVFFGNSDLPTYNFGNYVDSFGLESSIFK